MTSPVSVTAALKERGVSLPAAAVLQMMQWAGLVEDVEFTSSPGSGEIKHFLRLTERGLTYGINIAGRVSREKTEVASIRRVSGLCSGIATKGSGATLQRTSHEAPAADWI